MLQPVERTTTIDAVSINRDQIVTATHTNPKYSRTTTRRDPPCQFQLVVFGCSPLFLIPTRALCELTVNTIDDEFEHLFCRITSVFDIPSLVIVIDNPLERPVGRVVLIKYPSP